MPSSASCVLLLICVVCLTSVSGESKEDYLRRRDNFMRQERLVGTGGGVKLTQKEEAVNRILMTFKEEEIDSYRNDVEGQYFPPANNFLTSRPSIESSEVYKIIQAMPKGAALHEHEMAFTDVRWIVSNLTYHPNSYMCFRQDGVLKTGFFQSPPQDPECDWFNTNEAREASGDKEAYDDMLYRSMTIDEPDRTFPNQNALWKKFEGCFTSVGGLFFSEIGFDAILTKGLQEFYDDNVQYVEMRSIFTQVSRLDGSTYDHDWLVETYARSFERFVETHPGFVGAKIIPAFIRTKSKELLQQTLADAAVWQRQYPGLVAGFDIVSQEDYGDHMIYFIDQLLEPTEKKGQELPYMFHAGETNWITQEVDNNLIDAVLLNTTRIGHGYALAHHPLVLKYVTENNVAVEVSPVSNQVLGLVSDLRNHPAASLMAMGVPVVISSDDPSLWGSFGLSHDFYEAFMGLAGGWGDLATLKTLALDSIRFSAMSADEKQVATEVWQEKWDEFLDLMIDRYHQDVRKPEMFARGSEL